MPVLIMLLSHWLGDLGHVTALPHSSVPLYYVLHRKHWCAHLIGSGGVTQLVNGRAGLQAPWLQGPTQSSGPQDSGM